MHRTATRRWISVITKSFLLSDMVGSPVVAGEVRTPCPRAAAARNRDLGPLGGVWPRLVVLAVLLLGNTAVANTAADDPTAPPGPAESMRSYQTIAGWVRAWAMPETAAGLDLPEVAAAAVVLRLEGEIIGEATDAAGDEIERAGTVYRAARVAFEQADRRLPIDRDALFEERIGDLAAKITIELELAGEPIPLAPDEFAAVGVDTTTGLSGPAINPGIEGIGARLEDRLVVRTPGFMLRRNMGPGAATVSALTELTDDPRLAMTALEDLLARGYTFYRFRTSHLAQPRAGVPPMFLHRGGRVIDAREVSSVAGIRAMAAGLAAHLRSRAWPGVERYGLLGTYDPVRGRYRETTATPLEQALVVAALMAHERAGGEGAEASANAARELLADLAAVEPGEPEPWADAASAAACVWAATRMDPEELAAQSDVSALVGRCLAVLDDADIAEAGGKGGLIALGLASTAAHRDAADKPGTDAASAAVRTVFAETQPGQLVAQMPYLLYAEQELARATGEPIASAAALGELRRLVLEHQIRASDAGRDDRDLVGGVVFTVGRTALPTSQTLRPAAALAAMLREPSLTPKGAGEDRAMTQLVRMTEILRFVHQLAAGDGSAFMYARQERAEWGVRRAIWNQDMPIEATALALLACADTLLAIDRIGDAEAP